jgi:DNA-binding transcriptional MerR regulator
LGVLIDLTPDWLAMKSKTLREQLQRETQLVVPPWLLKNWVRRGLIPEPSRDENGRWVWSNEDFVRLRNLIQEKEKKRCNRFYQKAD